MGKESGLSALSRSSTASRVAVTTVRSESVLTVAAMLPRVLFRRTSILAAIRDGDVGVCVGGGGGGDVIYSQIYLHSFCA